MPRLPTPRALYTYWLPPVLVLQFLPHPYLLHRLAGCFGNNDEAAAALVLLGWSSLVLGACLLGNKYARQPVKSLLGLLYKGLIMVSIAHIILYIVVVTNMNNMENHN